MKRKSANIITVDDETFVERGRAMSCGNFLRDYAIRQYKGKWQLLRLVLRKAAVTGAVVVMESDEKFCLSDCFMEQLPVTKMTDNA